MLRAMLAYLALAAVAAAADVAGAVIVTTVHSKRHAPLRYFGVHLFEHTFAPHFHFGEETHPEAMLRPSAGWLAVIGLGVHTLFDGVAIAAGYMVSPTLGGLLFLAVIIHKIPEGFTVASIMLAAGYARGGAIAAGAGLGALTLGGALLTGLVAHQHVGYALALSAGVT